MPDTPDQSAGAIGQPDGTGLASQAPDAKIGAAANRRLSNTAVLTSQAQILALGALINLSGRQRMLSHRVVMFLALSQITATGTYLDGLISAAESALEEFQAAQTLILTGDRPSGAPRLLSARAKALFIKPIMKRSDGITGAALVDRFVAESKACAKNVRRLDRDSNDGGDEITALWMLVAADLLEFLTALVDAFEADLADAVSAEAARTAEVRRIVFGALQNIELLGTNINQVAVNALIEAARAGDTGRAFSVVATEIKSLSVQARTEAAKLSKMVGRLIEKK